MSTIFIWTSTPADLNPLVYYVRGVIEKKTRLREALLYNLFLYKFNMCINLFENTHFSIEYPCFSLHYELNYIMDPTCIYDGDLLGLTILSTCRSELEGDCRVQCRDGNDVRNEDNETGLEVWVLQQLPSFLH